MYNNNIIYIYFNAIVRSLPVWYVIYIGRTIKLATEAV